MRRSNDAAGSGQAGVSLVELTIAGAILSTVLIGITVFSVRNVVSMSKAAALASGSDALGAMAARIERLLRGVRLHRPTALLADDVDEFDLTLPVNGFRGFPVGEGIVWLAPSTSDAEVTRYRARRVENGQPVFLLRARGRPSYAHTIGAALRWWALAEPVDGPPRPFTGRARTMTGPVYFRGAGAGICFQVSLEIPDRAQREWGARVRGRAVADAFYGLYFQPVATFDERRRKIDLNRDRDRDDRFDVGRLRLSAWSDDPTAPPRHDIAVSPPTIVQTSGRWGAADIDRDGFSDPIFLWEPERGRVSVRLDVLMNDNRQARLASLRTTVRVAPPDD